MTTFAWMPRNTNFDRLEIFPSKIEWNFWIKCGNSVLYVETLYYMWKQE